MENTTIRLNNKRRLVYLILAVIVMISTIFFIPLEVFENNTILISAISGVSFSFLIFQAITDSTLSDWTNNEKKRDWRNNIFFILPIMVIAMPIVLITWHSKREDSLLLKDGIISNGIIIDGSSETIKRETFYNVKVKYIDNKAQEHVSEVDVTEREFNQAYKGMHVELIYSASNPDAMDLLLSDYERKKYIKN